MGLIDVSKKYSDLVLTVGKQVVNSLFPNDFEYYFVAFELVDSKLRTIEYLSFPVLPDSIVENKNELTNIKKSAGGITSLTTPTFVPREITLRGTFGRQFKFMLGATEFSFAGLRFSTVTGVFKKEDLKKHGVIKNIPFSPQIKTGYGVAKLLEAIIDKATALDDSNKPMSLYFYNLTLGNNYLVEPRSIAFSQDKTTNNMFWNYDLSLTAIAPLSGIQETSKSSLLRNFTFDTVDKEVNKLRSSIRIDIF